MHRLGRGVDFESETQRALSPKTLLILFLCLLTYSSRYLRCTRIFASHASLDRFYSRHDSLCTILTGHTIGRCSSGSLLRMLVTVLFILSLWIILYRVVYPTDDIAHVITCTYVPPRSLQSYTIIMTSRLCVHHPIVNKYNVIRYKLLPRKERENFQNSCPPC